MLQLLAKISPRQFRFFSEPLKLIPPNLIFNVNCKKQFFSADLKSSLTVLFQEEGARGITNWGRF